MPGGPKQGRDSKVGPEHGTLRHLRVLVWDPGPGPQGCEHGLQSLHGVKLLKIILHWIMSTMHK